MSVETEQEGLPRRFGRYTLYHKIGQGGMAEIYLARSQSGLGAGRNLALKQILPMFAGAQAFADLLIQEAKLSAALTHKNIAQVIDLGREQDLLYIVMEYVEGFDLRQLLKGCAKQKIGLPIDFVVLIVSEVLNALSYAHDKRDDEGHPLNIVHRDVSPSNVLLSFDGEVKLCDFGIALATTVADDVPDDAIQGKAGYMSPEAARGDALDARSDVFSAGIILWELLSGRRLYRGQEGGAPTLATARKAEIPDLPSRGLYDEATLHGIVYRALSKDPNARFQSAAEMAEALEDYAHDADLVASPIEFGEFLSEHFGTDIVEQRRELERSLEVETAPTKTEDVPRQEESTQEASTQAAKASESSAASQSPWRRLLVWLVLVLLVGVGFLLIRR